MNKKIENLDYNNLLFFDIETVRGGKTFDESHPYYDVWAWKQRDKDTNEIPDSNKVIESYYNKAALFPEWGKVVCISVGYINDNKLYVKSFVGEEKEILRDFVDLVKKTGRMLAGFNLINFDVPYVRKRFFVNGLESYLTDKQGNDVYMKPWLLDDAIFDLMVAWKGSGFMTTSMDELAMLFEIPSSKDNMHGNEVSKYYYDGKIDEIVEYCEKDVVVTANILRKWKGDELLEVESKNEPKQKPLPVLKRIRNFDEITPDIEKELLEILSGKVEEKELIYIEELLKAALFRDDFINSDQDSKEVREQKEETIKLLLEDLKN